MTLQPRLLTKTQAAEYCGLTVSGFSQWIACGKVPGPLPNSHRWDRVAIDHALDRLSKIASTSPKSELDRWLEKQGNGRGA